MLILGIRYAILQLVTRSVQIRRLFLLGCLLLARETLLAQGFSDMFAGRQTLTNISVLITGSNTNATVEPGEPLPAGKIGGHSVWISWLAPGNGLVTLSTAGSTFDTLLAVYTLEPGNGPPQERLEGTASDDDYGGLQTSFLQFGANSNQVYQIAVDGFNGASGDIAFQLNFLSSSSIQPTVLQVPEDHSLRLGDPLILTINLQPGPNLEFQWYLNGIPVAGQDDDSAAPTLVIPNLQRTNLGLYALKFELNDDSFFSAAIEIQVNSEGQSKVLARNKLPDAALSGLTGGVVLGYNGTQIFNTTNSIIDPNAPLICGVAPGATYWFSYQAPTNGLMTIDTSNSSFPTLLAVFTYSGVLTSYTNLVPVACDNNGGGTGTNTSQVQFVTTNGGNYFIVVGGVNGARGIAHLNYNLSPGLPSLPPVLTSQPQAADCGYANGRGTERGGWRHGAFRLSMVEKQLPAQTTNQRELSAPVSPNSGQRRLHRRRDQLRRLRHQCSRQRHGGQLAVRRPEPGVQLDGFCLSGDPRSAIYGGQQLGFWVRIVVATDECLSRLRRHHLADQLDD